MTEDQLCMRLTIVVLQMMLDGYTLAGAIAYLSGENLAAENAFENMGEEVSA